LRIDKGPNLRRQSVQTAMDAPRITKVEAEGRSAIVLHFSDGSTIEMVPVQGSGTGPDPDIQQVVLVALRGLLRRAGGARDPEP
jgi:hypothetical protein